jgi:DNA-directed RNA polymerase specialized sigma24 family protein
METSQPAATLGDVLYPDSSKPRVSEDDWVRLVRAVARDDALALQALYEKAHRPVFTLAMRLTGKRSVADEVTLGAFDDVWRRAPSYSTADGTVLGWIMNLTRARAIERPDAKPEAAKEQGAALKAALGALTSKQCAAIEAAFFSGRDATSPRVRTALHKLGRALAKQTDKPWPDHRSPCEKGALACAHALQALPSEERRQFEAHLLSCWQCRREIDALRPVLDTFVAWPTDVLRPPVPLQPRLAARIIAAARGESLLRRDHAESEPEWENVAPGISCKLLATDAERHMVSMLVRLVPGGEYPAHTHAGIEELHLLAGELWIDDRKLFPGDYNRAEPGTGDKRVWSETGCSCVLVTSTKDVLS